MIFLKNSLLHRLHSLVCEHFDILVYSISLQEKITAPNPSRNIIEKMRSTKNRQHPPYHQETGNTALDVIQLKTTRRETRVVSTIQKLTRQ